MSLDETIARALQAAIVAGQIKAIDGVPDVCHVLIQHATHCPMRSTRGQDQRCTCGSRLGITIHSGESADCQACAERPSEH
jgi:hypothetical protein